MRHLHSALGERCHTSASGGTERLLTHGANVGASQLLHWVRVVVGAKIEFEAGAVKGVAQPRPDGTYLAKFDALSKPGQVALSFVVTAGADTDILAGELALGEPHVDHEEAARPWARWASYAALALAALLLAAALLRKRAEARRNFQ